MARYADAGVFRIGAETFNEIDDWIRAADYAGRNAQFGVNALVMLMARTNQAFAMELSRGPLDPGAKRAGSAARQYMGRRFVAGVSGPATPQPIYRDAAWKIPVRRITQRYYKGWKVRRLAPGVWMLYNDSREAYFIEFGIHPHSIRSTDGGTIYDARVRRPIRKLSLMKTLRLMDESRAGDRVWEAIFAPFRPGRRYTQRGQGILLDEVQSVEGMRYL